MASTPMSGSLTDQESVDAFAGKLVSDIGASFATVMCSLGDRLGLFTDLVTHGPATSLDLAERTGLQERYVREWMYALVCAGYLTYDTETGRVALPPAHAAVLADEHHPAFMGGLYQAFPALVSVLDPLAEAFRSGGGIPISAYHGDLFVGQERLTANAYDHNLVAEWLPLMPEVAALLASDASVADVGCGAGGALRRLATTYPASRFTGYDVNPTVLAQARELAQATGLADRVEFVCVDATRSLPARHDVIFSFDMVHDTADPQAVFQRIHDALTPGGRYVCVEPSHSPRIEDSVGPHGTFIYAASLLHCVPVSLASGGPGLGLTGLTEELIRSMARDVGFADVRCVLPKSPRGAIYELVASR